MELGDTSDKGASPPQPKKREMSKNQRIQMVLMLQTLRHEKGSFHHCRQMFWHGSLDGSLSMEQGGAHAHIRPY